LNAQVKVTTEDLRRGQQAALQELQDARAEHARCAYAHALDRDDGAAREALIKSKQRLDLLEAELQGLSAATGESQRRERHAELERQVAEWQEREKAGFAAVDAAAAAFAKVEKAVLALAKLVKELEAAEKAANAIESRCVKEGKNYGFHTCSMQTHGQIEKLLQLAVGSARHNTYGPEVYRRPGEDVIKYAERAKRLISESVEEKVAALQQEAAKLA